MEPKITATLKLYGIHAHMITTITEMKADQDRIFCIEYKEDSITKQLNKKIIMKICETRSFDQINMNLQVMKLLNKDNIACPKPISLVKSIQNKYNHEFICQFIQGNKKYKAYCLSYIDGILCADIINKLDEKFYMELGNTVGRLAKSLQQYNNRDAVIYDDWDIRYTQEMYNQTVKYIDLDKLSLVKHYLNEFRMVLKPNMDILRKSVIHSDLHHHNILCDRMDYTKIKAIIDFADLNVSCTIFELTYCCSCFMLNKSYDEGIKIMLQLIKAYHKLFPLQCIEIDVLFTCICLHALIRVMARSKDITMYPHNEQHWNYYCVPCWKQLQQYKNTDRDFIQKIIRKELKSTAKL